MWPGDFEYSLACTVETWTRKLFVLWKDFKQCLQRTRSNFRGVAVELGLHLTYLKCCLSPPFVKLRLQWGQIASFGLLRGAISNSEEHIGLSAKLVAVLCWRCSRARRQVSV